MVYNQLQGGDAPHSLTVKDLISGAWQLASQQAPLPAEAPKK